MDNFVVTHKHTILKLDGTKATRDMNQDVGTPQEIRNLYDPISYTKAACIIQMLETILTANVFSRGLTIFLQDRSFQSCIPSDLYRNLQKALDVSKVKLPQNLNIEKIMTTWDSQPGYPLVSVERNFNKNPKVVQLTQSRYLSKETARSEPTNWYIPINYASKSNPNFNDTGFNSWLLKSIEEITISNLKPDDWLIVNKQQAYYYRVNYDVVSWKLIAKALNESYRNIHLGDNPKAKDTDINKLHRVDVVTWMCKYNYSQCRANTWKTFDQWRKTSKSLDANLEDEILCNAIRYGNERDWNYLYLMSENSDDNDRFRLGALSALGCSENATMLQRFLNLPKLPQYNDTYSLSTALKVITKRGSVGVEVAMFYVAKHFNFLCSRYSDESMIDMLGTITTYFTTETQLENFIKLLSENRTLNSVYLKFLEKTRPVISHTRRRVHEISEFFYSYHQKITDQIRSGGNLCRAIQNIFAFIFYSLIVIIIYT